MTFPDQHEDRFSLRPAFDLPQSGERLLVERGHGKPVETLRRQSDQPTLSEYTTRPIGKHRDSGNTIALDLARIIHEGFYCNRRYAATISLTAGGLAARSVNILFQVCLPPSRLRAPVSLAVSSVSSRTLVNNAGLPWQKPSVSFYATRDVRTHDAQYPSDSERLQM